MQATLDELTHTLPCAFVTVVSPTETLFSGCSGKFDPLDSRPAATQDVMWFASTTKLLTSICYLQLVDNGTLTLDTVLTDRFKPLQQAASRRVDSEGTLTNNDQPITLRMMLNQTSGFGMEMGETVQRYKSSHAIGFVNSCKVENLVNTPLVHQPGEKYEYGNSAEWLALMFPTLTGTELEDHLQTHVLKPLGMDNTTFYPFSKDYNLMPLRYGREEENGVFRWEPLNGQLDLLTLPRSREEIEYPAGGGGIYSNPSDYSRLLQHLLRHYLSLSGKAARPDKPLLSDASLESLFTGTLPESALPQMADMYETYWNHDRPFLPGEVDWTTGMALYKPKDGCRRGGWGRHAGSVGWGGAAGTDYWMDPESGIACVFSTQMLPGRCRAVYHAKAQVERAVYQFLEGK